MRQAAAASAVSAASAATASASPGSRRAAGMRTSAIASNRPRNNMSSWKVTPSRDQADPRTIGHVGLCATLSNFNH
ncbi:hypothetical protein GCM10022214_60150 [Actinomadura miaoliensis]|uniref:Secreted protein n=1 Tax=Actinomadura miaoliensis TaxID=430685 RepID=A0ABP7WM24_9ACTN